MIWFHAGCLTPAWTKAHFSFNKDSNAYLSEVKLKCDNIHVLVYFLTTHILSGWEVQVTSYLYLCMYVCVCYCCYLFFSGISDLKPIKVHFILLQVY